MSLAQLKLLGASSDENVVGAKFQKQYVDELSQELQETLTNQEKYDNLQRLYNAAKEEGLPKSLQM